MTTRSDFDNFRLRFEIMLDGDRLFAPVMVRVDPSQAIYGGMRGYAIRVVGIGPGTPRPGGSPLVLALNARCLPPTTLDEAANGPLPARAWVPVEVVAYGDRVLVLVRGKTIIDYEDPGATFRKGAIALVFPNGVIAHYRNIRVQQLPAPPVTAGDRSRWVMRPMAVEEKGKLPHECWRVIQRIGNTNKWLETVSHAEGFERVEYQETERRDTYVQLERRGGGSSTIVRLYADRAMAGGSINQLDKTYPGAWAY